MASRAHKRMEVYTYGDYLHWDDDERWEIIEGVPQNMTPAPSRLHQEILGELVFQVKKNLAGKKCSAYFAPFDVRLPEPGQSEEDTTTVVQPDLVVVCDPKKLDDKGCVGAPDWVVEILSPFTARKDQIEKVDLYEKHGVKEYWIIHPEEQLITVRILDKDGKYLPPRIGVAEGVLKVTSVKGLKVNLDWLFKSHPMTEKRKYKAPPKSLKNAN